MKNKKEENCKFEISVTPIMGQPENVSELINKYGTYNIQPTSDSDNQYPTISQGYPENGDSSRGFPESRKNEETKRRAAKKGDISAQEYTDRT